MAKKRRQKKFKSVGFDYEKVMFGFVGLVVSTELLEKIREGYMLLGAGDELDQCIGQFRDAVHWVVTGMQLDEEDIQAFIKEKTDKGEIKFIPMETSCVACRKDGDDWVIGYH